MKDVLPFSKIEELGASSEQVSKQFSPDDLVAQLQDENSLMSILLRSINDFSEQIQFAAETWKDAVTDVEKVDDKYTFNIEDKEYKVGNGKMTPRAGKGGEVTGKEAEYFILAKQTNLERVPLYSSGFYIVLRGPTLSELNQYYNYVSNHLGTQGNKLGIIYYLFSDLDIVRKTWTLIRSLIIDSNLAKWDKDNRLENYISFNDLSLIMLRIGRLMYPHGYDYISVCGSNIKTEGEEEGKMCDYKSEENVDLNDFQMTDFSRIPEDMVPQIAGSGVVTPEAAKSYREALEREIDIFEIKGYRFHMRVPTLRQYFTSGDAFNTKLIKAISNLEDDNEVNTFIRFNTSGVFSCWITKIESITEEGEIEYFVTDKEKIEMVMTQIELSGEGNNMLEKIRTFIKLSHVTHIGYSANVCPKCGVMPSQSVNGFLPFDPRTAFFTMSVMRLTQAS